MYTRLHSQEDYCDEHKPSLDDNIQDKHIACLYSNVTLLIFVDGVELVGRIYSLCYQVPERSLIIILYGI